MRALLLLAIFATAPMADPKRDFVDDLIPALASSADAGALLAKAPPNIKVSGSGPWTLSLPARDTKAALAAWGWKDAFAVSGDVHQRQFEIRRSTGSIGPNRIATVEPHAGRWSVSVTLAARPAGALPPLVAGASPAYPLPQYASTFDHIEIKLRDLAEIENALSKRPTMADVARELGPPDRDVGSGIHVLEYVLGKETVHVGTPDQKSVMYVRVGTRRVPEEVNLFRCPVPRNRGTGVTNPK